MSIQSFGTEFKRESLFEARTLARDIAYELASLIRPGMQEEDAHRIYKKLCAQSSVAKQWHPPKLRFGPNTVKNFRDASEPYVLKDEDIFFIDIGPIINNHEADYGETFVLGHQFDHLHIKESSEKIFREVSRFWRETRSTGMPLYEFAKKGAEKAGLILNMGSDGHRIGDFPHHVHFKGALMECEEQVVPNAWILEIHLLDPAMRFGAFYEDILTDEL